MSCVQIAESIISDVVQDSVDGVVYHTFGIEDELRSDLKRHRRGEPLKYYDTVEALLYDEAEMKRREKEERMEDRARERRERQRDEQRRQNLTIGQKCELPGRD